MNKLLAYSFLVFTLSSCQPATTEQANSTGVGTQDIKLLCDPIDGQQAGDLYRYFTVLQVGTVSKSVVMMAACEAIEPKDYAKHQIPADAISAVGGWSAGSGDYVYAIAVRDEIVIRRAITDEAQLTQVYPYQDWAIWKAGTLTLKENWAPTMGGLYALDGQDKSWLVLVDKIAGQWMMKGAVLEGSLPPTEDIRMGFENFELKTFDNFKLDEDEHSFRSDWGIGKFVVKRDRMHIVFEEKGSHEADQLMMVKISN